MTIVNRKQGGYLITLCSDSELETMLESDDIDTQIAAKAEMERRAAQMPTWCEYWGVD